MTRQHRAGGEGRGGRSPPLGGWKTGGSLRSAALRYGLAVGMAWAVAGL
ncbi:MAG: hypothetical protein OXG81_15070 [Acidobacteria bacterium]|nr:hypothetical protein [Acidobacteriota bacterium]